LFPALNFGEAFNFFSPIGKNYQGGVLGGTARVTIQMTHRYGAFITFSYLSLLSCYILFSKRTLVLKNTMSFVFIFLGTQVFLGILNIATQLSLPIAVTHNGVALLLLLSMLTLLYQVMAKPRAMTIPCKQESTQTTDAREVVS
jgi:cytochrome c oxidase assembly protein subunit 15